MLQRPLGVHTPQWRPAPGKKSQRAAAGIACEASPPQSTQTTPWASMARWLQTWTPSWQVRKCLPHRPGIQMHLCFFSQSQRLSGCLP